MLPLFLSAQCFSISSCSHFYFFHVCLIDLCISWARYAYHSQSRANLLLNDLSWFLILHDLAYQIESECQRTVYQCSLSDCFMTNQLNNHIVSALEYQEPFTDNTAIWAFRESCCSNIFHTNIISRNIFRATFLTWKCCILEKITASSSVVCQTRVSPTIMILSWGTRSWGGKTSAER